MVWRFTIGLLTPYQKKADGENSNSILWPLKHLPIPSAQQSLLTIFGKVHVDTLINHRQRPKI